MRRWTSVLRTPLGLAATALTVAVLVLAVVAPILWTDEANAVDTGNILAGPSADHWAGTDNLGRDIFYRTLVATRLSLSFPALISAVPMWDVDFGAEDTPMSVAAVRAALRDERPTPISAVSFRRLWFSDGGLCSNFPVQFFDGALPTRPTFAINLGSFPDDRAPDPDQSRNIEYARTNDVIPATYSDLPTSGIGALTGFAGLAFGTARNWNDSSHLQFPGYRDRIVKVFQTDREGGLNLDMERDVIDGLGARGAAAAAAMVEQFGSDHYREPHATGWDNHRWVRYRALLACMPAFLGSYAAGRAALGLELGIEKDP
ncbi:hypothetical protein ACFP8W_05270, partial [Nocardioides hankookensis]